jgi:hypothetical protein
MLLPDLEIRAYLSRYLAGSLTLDAFEDWFVPETWDIESYSAGAAKLATEIRSALFRLSAGEAAEDDFRAFAREKVNEVVWNLGDTGPKLDAESQTHDAVTTA